MLIKLYFIWHLKSSCKIRKYFRFTTLAKIIKSKIWQEKKEMLRQKQKKIKKISEKIKKIKKFKKLRML